MRSNHHGITSTTRVLTFLSFKGRAKTSTLDQITLPPTEGVLRDHRGLTYHFGEWLKRGGRGWEFASDVQLAKWAVDYWNDTRGPGDAPRRFDRLGRGES